MRSEYIRGKKENEMSLVFVCWRASSTGKVGRGNKPILKELADEWIRLLKQNDLMEYWTEPTKQI